MDTLDKSSRDYEICLCKKRNRGYVEDLIKEKNIKKALVTCSVNNPASRAVILANGGILENVRNGAERYWIEVANE